MRITGLEPAPLLRGQESESCASANSAIPANAIQQYNESVYYLSARWFFVVAPYNDTTKKGTCQDLG